MRKYRKEWNMEEKKISKKLNNFVNDNVKKLASVFPDAVKDGEVDFVALREVLGQFTEVTQEKYELTWAGKKKAKMLAQEDAIGRTLKYDSKNSINPEASENIFISGDNLEALKLLRQNYYGSIKMIYIDPPYNTGNDFVYNDNFIISKKQSDMDEGMLDENYGPMQRNLESTNRFHANWLSMIFSRLIVARDLLREDGAIFISIDDNEVCNLKKICDEVFGEKNFVSQLTIVVKPEGRRYGYFAKQHEYLLVYAKNNDELVLNEIQAEGKDFQYYDENGGFNLTGLRNRNVQAFNSSNRPNLRYPFYVDIDHPNDDGLCNVSIEPKEGYVEVWASTIDGLESVWRWGKEKAQNEINDLTAYRGNDSEIRIFQKNRSSTQTAKTVWENKEFISNKGTKEVQRLLGKGVFDFPKPVELIKQIITIGSDEDDYILDFFAGAGTTGQACIDLAEAGYGNRKFILIQYPEEIDPTERTEELGVNNIFDIAVLRIKKRIEELSKPYGFKAFYTSDTNIKWIQDEQLEKTLGQYDISQMNYNPDLMDFMLDTNDIDVVYELMLRQRDIPLSESIEVLDNIGSRTYLYGNSFLVCLESEITTIMVLKMAEIDPLPIKYIFRDSAFKDDIALKDETFRRLKANIEKQAGFKPSYTVEFI